jgi:hypothetical protein
MFDDIGEDFEAVRLRRAEGQPGLYLTANAIGCHGLLSIAICVNFGEQWPCFRGYLP